MSNRFLSFEKFSDSVKHSRRHYFTLFLVLSCLVPLAGYMFWGSLYFSDATVFLTGSAINTMICMGAYLINRISTDFVAGLYPDTHQSVYRVLCWFVLFAIINFSALYSAITLYDQTHFHGYHFELEPVLWAASGVFGGSLLGAGLLEMVYAFSQWKDNQHELQQLEQKQLQSELDVVKQQVNPHFLFNCLNSLSVLISEMPATAEKFVDEMSKVYRYLLSVNGPDKGDHLVTLETELRFISSYIYLLETRYESGISVSLQIADLYLNGLIAPLTLQTLIDNAIRHNIVSTDHPLCITIKTTPTGQLEVHNNMQKRIVRMPVNNAGLATLISRYKLLFNQAGTIQIKKDHSGFTVILPLIYT